MPSLLGPQIRTEGLNSSSRQKRKSLFGAALSGITSPFSTLTKSSLHVVGLMFFFEINFYNDEFIDNEFTNNLILSLKYPHGTRYWLYGGYRREFNLRFKVFMFILDKRSYGGVNLFLFSFYVMVPSMGKIISKIGFPSLSGNHSKKRITKDLGWSP